MLNRIKRRVRQRVNRAQVIGGRSLVSYEADVYSHLRKSGFTAKAAMRMAGSRSVAHSFRYGLSAAVAARKAAESADPRTLNASKKRRLRRFGRNMAGALLPMLIVLPFTPP